MCNVPTGRARSFKWAASLASLVMMALPINQAGAANPLGFYVGGAFGQARVDATAPDASGFRENHSAFKVMVGVRPISVVGAEFAYADFGHPSRLNGLASTDVTMKGASAFGIFYLPVPIVDIYAKAGVARLQSTATTAIVCPPGALCIANPGPISRSRTDVGFAAGVRGVE
ncbi:MAG: porin family protein [Gammaproteobacteria bacterium]|nr:MAG: porin family protein [Gammaproteobacteria bacterium]